MGSESNVKIMAAEKGFYESLVELMDNYGSVAQYKTLFKKHFNEEPTAENIKLYEKQLAEKHGDYSDDEESYEESYNSYDDESYD
jgi:hypothetical protein